MAKNTSCSMCSRVAPALTWTDSIPCRAARVPAAGTSRARAASSATTNLAAAPPAGRYSAKYSPSMICNHRSSFSFWTSRTCIALLGHEPDRVVVVLRAGLIEDGQAPGALGAGRAAKLEPVAAAGAAVGLAIQAQQVAEEFFHRVVGGGGRQQREQFVQLHERDERAFAGPVRVPVRGASGGERLIRLEQAVEEAARIEPVRPLLQRAQLCGQEAGADAPLQPAADA